MSRESLTGLSVEALLQAVDGPFEVKGAVDVQVAGFSSFREATVGSVCWLRESGESAFELLRGSRASVVICAEGTWTGPDPSDKLLIQVQHPQQVYSRILRALVDQANIAGIHPTAIVSEEARIGPGVMIGPYAVIEECSIGSGSIIGAHAIVGRRVQLGANVRIGHHCVIGSEGFGYFRNSAGDLENMPHIGGTIIESNVDIFPFTNVDRGTLGDTFIGTGTKIDHYCHIGHNSMIGSNVVITANVTVMGSATVGDDCQLGCGTLVRDGVSLAPGTQTGMGAVVTRSLQGFEPWVGNPARPLSTATAVNGALSILIQGRPGPNA